MPLSVMTCVSLSSCLDELIELTGGHPDPLSQDWLICPHPLMTRWVSRQLADVRRVRAQLELTSSAALYQKLYRLAWGRPQRQPTTAQLTWALLELLPRFAYETPVAAPLKKTFPGGAQGDKLKSASAAPLPGSRYLAAQELAEGVERLIAYRPHWLKAWSQGSDEVPEGSAAWWPALWRALKAQLGERLREAHLEQTCARLHERPQLITSQVRRVIVVGRAQYDALTLSLIKCLSAHIEVVCLSLDPTLASPEAIARLNAELSAAQEAQRDVNVSNGLRSPLPQACGALWSAHLERLDLPRPLLTLPPPEHPLTLPSPPQPLSPSDAQGGELSLLSLLKRELSRASELPSEPRALEPLLSSQGSSLAEPLSGAPLERALSSIKLHSCHSELRQVEALYQAVSASLRRDPTLKPRDILVLFADIERFVPLIEAVFHGEARQSNNKGEHKGDREGGEQLRLGAEISRPHGVNPFSDLLSQLMQLSLGRAYRYDVFQLLKQPLVSERFKLGLGEVLSLEAWFKRAGVRWGIDGEHRARFGLPAEELNTWTFGLDRLLLGALVGDDVSLFKGISPSAIGEEQALLSKFLDFFVVLKELIIELSSPATPKAWASALTKAARCLSAPTDESRWLLQELEADLYQTLSRSAGERPLSPQAITKALEGGLGRKPMLTGGGLDLVRFYPLDQAYAVPAKVICLMDMSEGRLPVAAQSSRLDPLTLAPLSTDRHRTFEQLSHVGLSALAAERELHVFYTGRTSVGEPLEPAPVISALIEELRGRFRLSDGRSLIETITTHHPLHPFSPQNFVGDERGAPTEQTISHEPRWLKGALVWREAQLNPKPRPPFALHGVEEPIRGVKRARVDTLAQLLKNPSEFFLRRGVGLTLLREESVTRERELLELDGLQSWSLKHRTLELALALEEQGRPLIDEVTSLFERVRAEGLLPAGKMGVVSFEQSFEGVAALVERFKEAREGRPKTPIALSLALPSGKTLRLENESLYEDRFIFTTPSKHLGKEGPYGKRLLEPWLYHVAMSASGRPYQGTHLVAADGSFERFPTLDQGAAQQLVDGWLVGLEAGLLKPLRFDPELSWSYLEGKRKGDPVKSVQDAWGRSSLKENLYAKRAFEGGSLWGSGDELEPEFEQSAELYFGLLERAVSEPSLTPVEALAQSLSASRGEAGGSPSSPSKDEREASPTPNSTEQAGG